MKNNESRMLNALKNINEISNIQVETSEHSEDKILDIGDFDIDGVHFSFFYSEGKPLIISELSMAFTYEKVNFKESLQIYQALNEFNKKSIAIKASVLKINKKEREVTVEFSYGILQDIELSKDIPLDLQPALSILSLVPEKVSHELKVKNVEHDYLYSEF